MKIYISYFYKVRFMKSNLLPISTAKWDPDWFHKDPNSTSNRPFFKNYGQYLDKNCVLNGSRCESLVFPENLYKGLVASKSDCHPSCTLKYDMDSEHWCPFMKNYYSYLNNLNFDCIMTYLQALVNNYKYVYGINKNVDVILLVHEPSSCHCAERPVLKKWFKQHGVSVHEWQGGK